MTVVTPDDIPVSGFVADGFQKVREVFIQNFTEEGEVGASVSVYLEGKPIVDLWGGWTSEAKDKLWQEDTVTTVFSITKGLTTTLAHILVDAGELDIDLPVAHYWPEFAAQGKADIPVRWLLSHRAGLIAPSRRLTAEEVQDWDTVVDVLANTKPFWTPNTAHGYHAITFGYLVGEVLRRITGVSVGTLLAEKLAGPLSADVRLGVSLDQQERCIDFIATDPIKKVLDPRDPPAVIPEAKIAQYAPRLAFSRIPLMELPQPVLRSLEVPAATAQTNARALAKIYSAIASGQVLSEQRVRAASTSQNRPGDPLDYVLGQVFNPDFGEGYMLGVRGIPGSTFGHGGAGGSFACADTKHKLGYAYVMNLMLGGTSGEDERTVKLMTAVYQCLDKL